MPYKGDKTPRLTRLMQKYDITSGAKLAAVLECAPATGVKRFRDPNSLTVADLDRLNRFAHIPIEEIRGAI